MQPVQLFSLLRAVPLVLFFCAASRPASPASASSARKRETRLSQLCLVCRALLHLLASSLSRCVNPLSRALCASSSNWRRGSARISSPDVRRRLLAACGRRSSSPLPAFPSPSSVHASCNAYSSSEQQREKSWLAGPPIRAPSRPPSAPSIFGGGRRGERGASCSHVCRALLTHSSIGPSSAAGDGTPLLSR